MAMTAVLRKDGHHGVAPAAGALPVLAYLAFAYLSVNVGLPRLLPADLNVYFAQPAIWLGLAALCLHLQPDIARPPLAGVSRSRREIVVIALLAAAFQIAVYAIAGVLYGFGYSTYAHGSIEICLNLIYLGSLLWGLEMTRAYLLREWSARPGIAFFVVTGILVVVTLPLTRWQSVFGGGQTAFEATGQAVLPATAESSLATLLAAAGGPWASLLYRATTTVVEWTSPVLPSLDWMLTALIGTLAPACAFLVVRSLTMPEEPAAKTRAIPGWMLAFSATIVAVIWLNTGLLGIRPALISGLSMEPNLVAGDIVVTRPVPSESLEVGDIIRFQSGEVPILHRIVEIKRESGGLTFVTQGDNNNLPDGPVPASAVEGKVVLVIPKLGILPIELKSWLAR